MKQYSAGQDAIQSNSCHQLHNQQMVLMQTSKTAHQWISVSIQQLC